MKKLLGVLLIGYAYSGHAYNIDTYLKTLDRYSVNTLEEAVFYLPTEIKSSFTLMYQGHGLRGTTYNEPGALVFDPNGTFFATFGSPNQALGDEIEILQFNKERARMELYSLKFPLKRGVTGKIVRPSANPSQCLRCHNADPQVLWGEYDKWDGAYGNAKYDVLEGTELNYFNQFRSTTGRTGAYQYLVYAPSPFSPYSDPNHPTVNFAERPNTYIGLLATRLNALRLARKVKASPAFPSLRLFLLAGLANCKVNGPALPEVLAKLGVSARESTPAWDGTGGAVKEHVSLYGLKALLAYQLMQTNFVVIPAEYITIKNMADLYRYPGNPYIQALDSFGTYLTPKDSHLGDKTKYCEFLRKELKQ